MGNVIRTSGRHLTTLLFMVFISQELLLKTIGVKLGLEIFRINKALEGVEGGDQIGDYVPH